MSRKVAVTASLVAGLLSHAATVKAEPRESAAPQVDACTLLDSAAISEVVGLPVDTGTPRHAGYESDGAYSSACTWLIAPTKELPQPDPVPSLLGRNFVILHVMIWPGGSGRSGKYLQAFRDAALHDEIPLDPVPRDVGDEALWWGDGLAVRKGDASFGISVFLADSEAAQPGMMEELLAPFVLRRLAEIRKPAG